MTALARVRPAAGSSAPVWLVLLLVVCVSWVAVGLRGGNLTTAHNLQDIAVSTVALGLVAVGQTLVVLAGSLDLSVAYLVGVTANSDDTVRLYLLERDGSDIERVGASTIRSKETFAPRFAVDAAQNVLYASYMDPARLVGYTITR